MGVGMPHCLYLDEFGKIICEVFGDYPYHVGSSLTLKKGWRDVDVRLLMNDRDYDSMLFGRPDECHTNLKWIGLCKAFSALGEKMTGLPIDFQIQQMSRANELYGGDEYKRSALGVTTQLARQKGLGR